MAQASIDISIPFETKPRKKKKRIEHTIPLISAPLTELLPLLRLHLAVITRRSISRIRILRFRTEEFALGGDVSIKLIQNNNSVTYLSDSCGA